MNPSLYFAGSTPRLHPLTTGLLAVGLVSNEAQAWSVTGQHPCLATCGLPQELPVERYEQLKAQGIV